MTLHNWLEDGKRLRPVRAAHAAPFQRAADVTMPLAEAIARDIERAHVASGRARAGSEANATPATPPALMAALSPEVPPVGSLPLGAMPPAAELTSAAAILDAAEGMDVVRRRLMFVRYLVHQRVYNEGFSADEMPDQYRWDGGIEGPSGN